ncbi:MAG: SCO family protein, partial [Alphaproteobacteria bacterium]|nr:SCO family protein [Alphaproteobacteria bacterium]
MTFSRIMMFIAAMVIAVAIGLTVNTLFLNKNSENLRTTGVAAIGGSFELVNHKGETVRDTDYRGSYLLVMFGFTNCPDVCPTELQLITEALGVLGPTAKIVQPLMITVDPERDTVEVLA